MRIPAWLAIAVAAVVIAFGLYRLRLFALGAERYAALRDRGMMYRIPRRNHLFIGIVFCALGTWLLLQALGVV
ncbi:MAG: hypothetical protein D6689_06670 [Deltaproteobacteria bacterium]|nr:MAG: hypothetical protein D6689_06670 [Deltaproteobacteria bacterium]